MTQCAFVVIKWKTAPGCPILGTSCPILGAQCPILGAQCPMLGNSDCGHYGNAVSLSNVDYYSGIHTC